MIDAKHFKFFTLIKNLKHTKKKSLYGVFLGYGWLWRKKRVTYKKGVNPSGSFLLESNPNV
ncbi:hypothetical protein CUC43_33890 (plasmid) [Bacillus thuringiensis LM1212]|nr:hypothetical protein CUC43_32520 [Bacillus thuringiensis LM1212]AXY11562.1 hypothetical protein CUC43_33890 [Bacillus thuringiensis LM1212]